MSLGCGAARLRKAFLQAIQLVGKASGLLGRRGKGRLSLGNPATKLVQGVLRFRNEHPARKRRCRRRSGLPNLASAVGAAHDPVPGNVCDTGFRPPRQVIHHVHVPDKALCGLPERLIHLHGIEKAHVCAILRSVPPSILAVLKAHDPRAARLAPYQGIHRRRGCGNVLHDYRVKPAAKRSLQRNPVFGGGVKAIRKRSDHRALRQAKPALKQSLGSGRKRSGGILRIVQVIQLGLLRGGLGLHLPEIRAEVIDVSPEGVKLCRFPADGRCEFSLH